MKLATLRDGSRDGLLHLVSSDNARSVSATDIVPTLRAAMDTWATTAPRLLDRAAALEAGSCSGIAPFDPTQAAAPMPRAVQWLDGSVFPNHGRLMQRAFGMSADMHDGMILVYQGASDGFIGPHDDVVATDEAQGIDFEAEIGVVVDDVPLGVSEADAAGHIKLLLLINDVSLRSFGPPEMKSGFGFLHAKPATAFAPLAITPDEAGAAWIGTRLHLPVQVELNGTHFGNPDAREMGIPFAALIAYVARTRSLCAGTIIGSGTVSNEAYRQVGSGCIAERRAIEMIDTGGPKTPFMRFGDSVRMEVRDAAGASLFGVIEQRVARANGL